MPKINIPKDELDKNTPLLPIGWYKTLISLVEYKKTSKGDKMMYVFHHTILEGEHTGKKLMKWLVEPYGSLGPWLEALKAPKNEDGSYDVDPQEAQGQKIQVHNSRGKNDKNNKDTNDLDDARPFDYTEPKK
jgi:hypothetical protein